MEASRSARDDGTEPGLRHRGDGDGWVACELGHRHWGLYGAAGLLLVAPGPVVLLQHRAVWSHHGDTWGIPGGARTSGETAVQAALREAHEETGVASADLVVEREVVDDHGGWAYTTVLARTPVAVAVQPQDAESIALAWVPLPEVAGRVLHPGFAAGWPAHLAVLR